MTHPQTAALIALLERVEAGIDETDYWWHDAVFGNLREPLFMKGQPAFYGSLDAAKALHEAVMPGWIYDVTNGSAFVIRHCDDDEASNPQFCGECESSARAWLIAIIRALIADTEGR